MSVDFDALFKGLARSIQAPPNGDRAIGETIRRILISLAGFDEIVVFAYRGKDRPVELFSTFAADDYAVFVALYQAGPYLLDPFYHRAVEMRPGVWRMRELAPDRFFASEYRRTYYVQTGLAEEVGFFVPSKGEIAIVLSLMRKEKTGVFTEKEVDVLRKAEPIVAALMHTFWNDLGGRFAANEIGGQKGRRKMRVRSTEHVWEELQLTKREAAIVELVLQGHSSESIGLKLAISTGTVKVHRRNVYRKLGISSQTQLMSLYLRGLSPSTKGA